MRAHTLFHLERLSTEAAWAATKSVRRDDADTKKGLHSLHVRVSISISVLSFLIPLLFPVLFPQLWKCRHSRPLLRTTTARRKVLRYPNCSGNSSRDSDFHLDVLLLVARAEATRSRTRIAEVAAQVYEDGRRRTGQARKPRRKDPRARGMRKYGKCAQESARQRGNSTGETQRLVSSEYRASRSNFNV